MSDMGTSYEQPLQVRLDQLQPSSFNPDRGVARDAGSQVYISHEKNTPALAREYFSRGPTNPALVEKIFDADSRWGVPVDHSARPYQDEPVNLMSHYLETTRDVYQLAQHSLGQVNWFGYNDHGPLHIQRVCEAALHFGNQAQFSEGELRRVIAGAAFHDLGNLVNRDVHSWESPEIALAIFPQLNDDLRSWEVIERAIQVHELGTHKLFLRDVLEASADERIRAMRDIFRDEGLALLIADKVQFSRERVNDLALTPEAIFAHRYSQLNLYWSTSSANYVPEQRAFVWELRFRPEVEPAEMSRFGRLATGDMNREGAYAVIMPPAFEKSLSQGQSLFVSAHDLFWELSTKLVRRMMECSFALFSARGENNIDEFVIRFRGSPSEAQEYRFKSGDLDTHTRLRL